MGARLLAVAIGLTSLTLGTLAYLVDLTHSGLPQRTGSLEIPGLHGPVEVRFDAQGVPHVRAETHTDLAAVLGFLHANDRLTQMELGRRAAQGRLAELLGPSLVAFDSRMRRLGVARAAAAGVERAPKESQAWLDAYARGVNAWVEQRGHDLPPGLRLLGVRPEPWRPADSAAFAILMAYDLGEPERTELRRTQWLAAVGPERLRELLGVDRLHVAPELEALLATLEDPAADRVPAASRGNSNNWALAPRFTADGGALLAGDPHLNVGLPARFFAARLSAPGFEVFAATLPGTPAPVIGVGEHRAWSLTNIGLDGDDLFFEELDETGSAVRRPEGWLALERRTETVDVRFGEPVEVAIAHTDIGPFLPGDPEAEGLARLPRSLAWTALEPGDPLTLFLDLVREPSLERALESAGTFVAPGQNLVIAQADGRLAFQAIGRVPERRAGDGRLPTVAWTGEYGWSKASPVAVAGLRSVPPSNNPRLLDPTSGRLVTANADTRPAGYDQPFEADWAPPHRTQRIHELLDELGDSATVEELAAMQLDVVSVFARELAAALAQDDLDGAAARVRAILTDWDGSVAESGPGLLFVCCLRELMEAIFADEWEAGGAPAPGGRGPEYALLRLLQGQVDPVWFDDCRTAAVEGREEMVGAALERALEGVEARFGADPTNWRLDAVQSLTLRHPLSALPGLGRLLDRGPIGLPGHSSTVAAIWARWEADALRVTGTASLRLVADAAEPAASRHSQPGGQSGHPRDPHYADQLDGWRSGEGFPVPWTVPDVSERRILRFR